MSVSRRTPRIALAAGLALAVAACGTGSSGSTNAASGQTTKQYKVTLVQGVATDVFYTSMACGARSAAKELGITLDVQGGNQWDASVQTPIVNGVIAKKADAIVIAPNDSKA